MERLVKCPHYQYRSLSPTLLSCQNLTKIENHPHPPSHLHESGKCDPSLSTFRTAVNSAPGLVEPPARSKWHVEEVFEWIADIVSIKVRLWKRILLLSPPFTFIVEVLRLDRECGRFIVHAF